MRRRKRRKINMRFLLAFRSRLLCFFGGRERERENEKENENEEEEERREKTKVTP